VEIFTKNLKETQKIARLLGAEILHWPPAKGALILALAGELGSGKTSFVQGLARGLGILHSVKSPSFLLLRAYRVPKIKKTLIHLDCYRLKRLADLRALGWDDFLANPQNIIALEWADKIKKRLPAKNTLWLKFAYQPQGGRRINFSVKNKA